ncbi:ribosomal protection tetracycline resistance protein [Pullulanibacillus pueri]|uniref:Tetracycline resistance protein n=1 Tax=Pullulanibacillus pueri TaxID=1437324 RepID=A0A8J2ZW11_9BACL|nr:TetM/TetW/TetO/TetS family tetracycline resistance ribosomal protection protein [Pullulanibacillus pueri]MBM7682412.1 ribosomal protection tetracycline resistance protein [Pullulanibacillus pueri]GGH81741.1 tetracycline resistance protein [Pullulanibacillus pueri]
MNIGLFAHVDAGKTTTTEQILYRSGKIRSLGSVDTGTTQTDWLEVERNRGISIKSAVTRFNWKDQWINLVDTPGHVDFIAEVERALHIMDGAILIVSAVEGVQAQTEVVWQALRDLHIPTFIYMNKMDRVGADPSRVLSEIEQHLTREALPIQAPCGEERTFSGVMDLLDEGMSLDATLNPYQIELMESLAEENETLMANYLEKGTLQASEMLPELIQRVRETTVFPVLFGASNQGIGITELMDAIVNFFPKPEILTNAPVSGIIFKMERDETMGKVSYVRLYKGKIENRENVYNLSRGIEEKVTQIRRIEGNKAQDIGKLEAGDIAAVYGWSEAKIGDIIGSADGVPTMRSLGVPLLTVQVMWENEDNYTKVVEALQMLTDEDPLLGLQWIKEKRELHLKVMGSIQMEILVQLVKSRFNLDISFGKPSVIYQETPKTSGEGFIAYTMPKPCWAVLRFKIEPGERGSGISYHSIVRKEDILERYQNEVARTVPEALKQGLYGWEVTDLKVTLVAGEHHVMHTHPLDFVVATPMGIMDGLANVGTKLLEPILHFKLTTPETFSGKLMNELIQMRGTFDTPKVNNGRMELSGSLPVATSLDFPARLGSLTKGRGTLKTQFKGYQECPPDVEATRPRIGVNPLDQSKYILSVRNALK